MAWEIQYQLKLYVKPESLPRSYNCEAEKRNHFYENARINLN